MTIGINAPGEHAGDQRATALRYAHDRCIRLAGTATTSAARR